MRFITKRASTLNCPIVYPHYSVGFVAMNKISVYAVLEAENLRFYLAPEKPFNGTFRSFSSTYA